MEASDDEHMKQPTQAGLLSPAPTDDSMVQAGDSIQEEETQHAIVSEYVNS